MTGKIKTILMGVVTSFYMYPFSIVGLPEYFNTKNITAMVGVFLFAMFSLNGRQRGVRKDIIISAVIAFTFSLSCYFSVLLNSTTDYSYATYFISFFVWMFGAYAVCSLMRAVHGRVDLNLITAYLAWIALIQCILAQLISSIQPIQTFVDSFVSQETVFLHRINRIYGIGASLDSAGVRFAVTLVLISHKIHSISYDSRDSGNLAANYVAFLAITVLGCMISRTTFIGAILGAAYIAVRSLGHLNDKIRNKRLKAYGLLIVLLAALIPFIIHLYMTNPVVKGHLRFAFEILFNGFETGRWHADSLDKLNNTMWIWPEDRRTWFLGSGLFDGWIFNTDIGYCRFILYCGVLGLSIFSTIFIFNAVVFAYRFEDVSFLALVLLAMTFIIWIKVSTDLFQIYALLLCADGRLHKKHIPNENNIPHSRHVQSRRDGVHTGNAGQLVRRERR